ncbi:molecular chaperone HtpG [Stomatobaculum sp. F0698]|uniref:molecular chaperone HtpG n=1 Tax=Stomatobaculum sp. F0698 TaxID=3059030 RepID=UPI002729D39A|nr:molecular chaperone HtpG [Stomatobaculum sp. F0698]WLD87646.1 molecular chaperone HtpG [Stomatobaculum sp. F0698]
MENKQGSLSIHSDNIFPIIKKWLYSDHDIFVRELVSNGCDAVTKLKKLALIGEYQAPEQERYEIRVEVSPKERRIRFTDNGVGMSADEIEKYINQIAFSGARDFIETYKDKANEDQIIGHFGLGFYSAFMVADRVVIETKSYREAEGAVHWESEGGTEYSMQDGTRSEHGTEITLYLSEESREFSELPRVREVLEKYCGFMPVAIYLTDADAAPETELIDPDEKRENDVVLETVREEAEVEEKTKEDGSKELVELSPARERLKIQKRPQPINDTEPLWKKHPNEVSKDEYEAFYRKVFMDYREPLFWIHLNMDYPFRLQGILYFPHIELEYEAAEGKIKLFNNQVFIADNIKEVIPEFLLLLKGVIDCPDLPLNVSRSALQNDGFVKKISAYITKKVAEKLTGMCKTDRENYEKYWDDIAPFVQYGCLKDEKFEEKVKDAVLFKNLEKKYLTLEACLKENEERFPNRIFYVTDEKQQRSYIDLFKSQNIDAVILPHAIDMPFIQSLEAKNKDLKFLRIDADLNEALCEKEEAADESSETREKALASAVQKAIGEAAPQVKLESFKNAEVAAMLTLSEESRRMQDMMRQYGMADSEGMFGASGATLVLNRKHPLVKYLQEQVVVRDGSEAEETAREHAEVEVHESAERKPKTKGLTKQLCEQLYDLACIQQGTLSPERMKAFIERSNALMEALTK